MNFFESQDEARRNTFWLIILYFIAVVLIILSVYAGVIGAVLLTEVVGSDHPRPHVYLLLLTPQFFGAIAAVAGAVILLGTLYKIIVLRGGGATVAEMLGGRLVSPNSPDLKERRVLNIVEEMAIAAGTAVPPVYLLEDEAGINAFAAGFSPRDAVIGVTRGCIEKLTRDELQGVIAHEFSHILNGDMRLNIRLIGVLHGILVVALVGYTLFRISASGTRRTYAQKKGGDPRGFFIVLGLILMTIGYVGVFFGRLIKSAVSRQREYLADASAVQFTRNPLGLAGALKKIGGLGAGSRLQATRAEEASHMYFANGLKQSLFGLLATHPPLAVRIKRIDPSFEGSYTPPSSEYEPGEGLVHHFAPSSAPFHVEPAQVEAAVGNPRAEHVAYAAGLVQALPPTVREKAREPYGARAVVFALLIPPGEDDARVQQLSKQIDPTVLQELLRVLPEVAALPRETRLPLLDLCLPALKQLSPQQAAEFHRVVEALIKADKRCTLFEYAVRRIVARHLLPREQTVRSKYRQAAEVGELAAVVLSTLAHAGAREPASAERAFNEAAKLLDLPQGARMMTRDQCSLQQVDRALKELALAVPELKRKLVLACAACAALDGEISVDEAELLRSTTDALDCPLPPFLRA